MNRTKIELTSSAIGTQSQELALIIKKCLKFLYAFRFGSKDIAVFFIRQSNKVFRSIVVPDTIKMMNYPSFRQWFTIYLLPYHDMFTNITSFISILVFGNKQSNISSNLSSPTFPYCSTKSSARTNTYSISTRFAMLRAIINEFTALALLSMPKTTFLTLPKFSISIFTIILPMIFPVIHKLIVTQITINSKPASVLQIGG